MNWRSGVAVSMAFSWLAVGTAVAADSAGQKADAKPAATVGADRPKDSKSGTGRKKDSKCVFSTAAAS